MMKNLSVSLLLLLGFASVGAVADDAQESMREDLPALGESPFATAQSLADLDKLAVPSGKCWIILQSCLASGQDDVVCIDAYDACMEGI